MATYTLKDDGTGTIPGSQTTFSGAVSQLSSNDILQVHPGTYFEVGDTNFDGKDNVTIELVEDGNVELDYSGRSNNNLIQIKNVTTTFTGVVGAVLVIKNTNNVSNGIFMVWNTTATPKLISRNILVQIYGNNSTGGMGIRCFGGNTEVDIERWIVSHVRRDISIEAGTCTFDAKGCMFLEAEDGFNGGLVAGTFNFDNCLLGGAYSDLIDESNASTTVNLTNCIIAPGGSSAIVRSGLGTVNIDTSQVYYRYNGASMTSGITEVGTANEVEDEITPSTWSNFDKGGMVGFCVDDSSSYDDYQFVVKAAADERDIKICFAVDLTHPDLNTFSDAQWTQLAADVEDGHEMVVHTRRASNLGSLSGMGIRFTGTATTATVTIADGIMTLEEDTSTIATITLSDYFDLGDLATYIHNSVAEWTAVTYSSDGTTKVPSGSSISFGTAAQDRGYTATEPAFTLADVTDSDANGVTLTLLQDQTRYFDEEIGNCIVDIQNKTDVTPTSLVYPSSYDPKDANFDNVTTEIGIENQNITIARANSSNTYLWGAGTYPISGEYGYSVMSCPGYALESGDGVISGQTENVIKGKGLALGLFCKITGTCVVAYGHNSITKTEIGHFMDGVISSGCTVGTMSEMAAYVRYGVGAHSTVSIKREIQSDIIYYTHDQEEAERDLAQNITVNSGYSHIDLGKNNSDRNAVGIDGDPIASSAPTVGPTQSKLGAFHPENL